VIRTLLGLIALGALPSALAAQQGSSTPVGVVAPPADSVGPFEINQRTLHHLLRGAVRIYWLLWMPLIYDRRLRLSENGCSR